MKKIILALVISLSFVFPVLAQDGGENDPLGGATEFAKAENPTDVTLLLDWTPNTNHTGFYVAQALGYYEEANLNVSIQEPTDLMVEAVVANGAAEFGVSFQDFATYAIAGGTPVVSVAALVQHNTSAFVTLHDQNPIESATDMAGLRYGGFGQPDLENAVLNTLLTCDGAEADSVEYIDVGYVDLIDLMQRDRIDLAWIYYGVQGIDAELRGVDLDVVMMADYTACMPDYYTPILITRPELIDKQPDVVAAFVQATARGYAYAIQQPDEAAQILSEAVPELDPEWVKASAEWFAGQYQADAPRWGQQTLAVWQGFNDFLVENGILDAGIDAEAAFTNEFLPGDVEE